MTKADDRFARVVEKLDARHREDPRGKGLDHALAVAGWVNRLRPEASAALRLAARAQHLGRWRVPRDSYPPGRPGYLRWRADLQEYHADETAAILSACGYDAEFVARVQHLMRKQGLPDDPETQTLEDALCLAFMERQLAEFSSRHADPKLQRILKKTWQKMSPAGREAALGLELPDQIRALLLRSIG